VESKYKITKCTNAAIYEKLDLWWYNLFAAHAW